MKTMPAMSLPCVNACVVEGAVRRPRCSLTAAGYGQWVLVIDNGGTTCQSSWPT